MPVFQGKPVKFAANLMCMRYLNESHKDQEEDNHETRKILPANLREIIFLLFFILLNNARKSGFTLSVMTRISNLLLNLRMLMSLTVAANKMPPTQ